MPATTLPPEIFDVEVVERTKPAASAETALVRIPAPAPQTALPPLFTLPPELDPQRIIAEQRARLEEMLSPRPVGDPQPAGVPAQPIESSEAFLARAMSLLEANIATMERALERVVGRDFAPKLGREER